MKVKLATAAIIVGFAMTQGLSAQDSSNTVGGVHVSHTVIDTSLIAQGWSLKKFMGEKVVNEDGDKVGKLKDTIVALDGDKVVLTYGIVDVGGFLGMGKKHIALPINAFTVNSDGKHLNLFGASKKALKELPEFKYVKH